MLWLNFTSMGIYKRTRIQIGSHEIKRPQYAWQPESRLAWTRTQWGFGGGRDRTVLRRDLTLRQECGPEQQQGCDTGCVDRLAKAWSTERSLLLWGPLSKQEKPSQSSDSNSGSGTGDLPGVFGQCKWVRIWYLVVLSIFLLSLHLDFKEETAGIGNWPD